VLDERWRPARVVLAASEPMKPAAQALTAVLRRKCPHLKIENLVLPNAYDYPKLADAFMNFLGDQQEPGGIGLNVTGGTKLMAVAAQEVFRADGRPVFYVNADTDEVIVIGDRSPSEPLKARLQVRDLLESHGFKVESDIQPQISAAQRDLAMRLIDHVGQAGTALGRLNLLASGKQLRVALPESLQSVPHLDDMIHLFSEAKQCRRVDKELRFSDEAARGRVNGGWLEEHVYSVMQDLRGKTPLITDVTMNARIIHPDGKTRNELDIAFLYRNTLHLIECKTANLAHDGAGGDDKATEAIYKMEALLKAGGLRTRGLIVDYRGALSAHEPNLQRARVAGIEVISGIQLKSLKERITRWI
jgi:hypothetical protein